MRGYERDVSQLYDCLEIFQKFWLLQVFFVANYCFFFFSQVDEYYDEYEDEGEEQLEGEEDEEEYEEEEKRKPTAEELEYLALRARLKERIRKNRQMEGGSALAKSREKKSRLPFDK